MAKYLVIVESPAKVKTIKKFLGANYEVEASNGHVRDFPKSQFGIDVENDFEPKYITIRGKGELLAKLRKAAKKADKIYLATDPDREGEAIAWHLAYILNQEKEKITRVTFNEITKSAVKKAIKEPRNIDLNLVDAQQARRVLDRIVGYKISPILWKKVKRGLSAGRVQSVAVKLIVDREEEIEKFIPEEYWNIYAELLDEKTNKKLSWKYLTKIRGHFYNFLEYCRNLYDIPNQLENIKIPKNIDIKKEIIFWELKDFDNFISNLDNNNIIWKTLWFTFMFTGCRFNEIRALKDDDISNNKISIKYSLSSKKTSNPNSRTATKNHKTYIKQIPDKLQLQIDLYKTWKKENNISGDFLFGGDNPLPEKTIRNHLIKDIQSANKKLSKDAKLKIITPHGFRHSYVSLLIHLGISTKIIAELIGDREEQVIKTYGHLYSGVKDAAIAMLNDKINQIL